MTKNEFLHWAAQYKHTVDARALVMRHKFSEDELDRLKLQIEGSLAPLADTAERMRRVGA